MRKIYSYYMTQRPPAPGAMPKVGLMNILYLNDDCGRVYVPEIGCDAWAKLQYTRELMDEEVAAYELIPDQYEVKLNRNELNILTWLLENTPDNLPYDIEFVEELFQKLREIKEGK